MINSHIISSFTAVSSIAYYFYYYHYNYNNPLSGLYLPYQPLGSYSLIFKGIVLLYIIEIIKINH